MPAAVVAVASMAAGSALASAAVGAGLVVAGGVGAALITGATAMAVSSIAGDALGLYDAPAQAARQPAAQAARGTIINTAGAADPLPVIYGERRIGGTLCLTEVSGASKEYLSLVVAHCEGEIEAINNIRIDNVLATDARYSGLVDSATVLGADAQAANATIMAHLPGVWTSNDKLSGVAYTYLRLKYNQNAFHGLPLIAADIKGRKVYDPRDGLTKWSANPALCLRDYLTNTRFGRGIATADIDDASIIAAANYCDQTISTPAGAKPRHTCNIILDTAQTSMDNLRALLATCRGWLVFSGGKYKLVLDAPAVASFTFNEDNIVGAWRIALSEKRRRFNRVRATWIDPAREWQPSIHVADSAAYRAADNGLMLEAEIACAGTTSAYEAQITAGRNLRQSRFGTVAQFTATIAGTLAEVGDVVNITHSTPGWTAKPFRVVNIALLNSDEAQITAQEYDDAVYADDPLTAPATAPGTNLPDPFFAAPPGAIVAATQDYVTYDGVQKTNLLVSCGASDAFVVDYEFQHKLAAASQWITTGTVVEPYVEAADVALGAYDLRVRARNALGVNSAWTTASYTVVAGVSIPVPDVGALNAIYEGTTVWLSWLPVTDVRRLIYEVRCGDAWGSGAVYQAGAQTRFKVVKDGTWWVAAKTVSGVYSSNPKSIRVEGAVLVDNVISTISESGTGWSGAQDGIYEPVSGEITLAGTALFSSLAQVSAVSDIALEGGFVGTGSYTIPAANRVDIGTAGACQVSAALDFDVYDPFTTIGARPVFSALPSLKCPLGGTGEVALEMNLAQTDGIYSGWQPFVPGNYLARLFDFRLNLSSTGATVTPVIRDLVTTIDVPDRIDSGQVTTPAGPLAVTFAKPFNAPPKLQITILNAQQGDDAVATAPTINGFTLTIKNAGASVSRDVHYLAQGY